MIALFIFPYSLAYHLFIHNEVESTYLRTSVSSEENADFINQELLVKSATTTSEPTRTSQPVPFSHEYEMRAPEVPFKEKLRSLFQLGLSDPRKLISILDTEDPFGTLAGPEQPIDCSAIFQMVNFPSIVNEERATSFRNNVVGSFIFYQHLRKAGGTSFCDLANSNMSKENVPPY